MKHDSDDNGLPIADAKAKRSHLAKDAKIKKFWETLANDWLSWGKKKVPGEKPAKPKGRKTKR